MKCTILLIPVLFLFACSPAAPNTNEQDLVAEAVEETLAAVQLPEEVSEPQDCDCSVLTRINPDNEALADVYILDNATGEESFFASLEDIAVEQNSGEYHNGNIYLVKEVGYEPGSDDQNWTHELWKFDADANGTMLFANKGLSYRVSPDENYLAIEYVPEGADMNGGGKLAFFDLQGNLLHEYSAPEFRVEQAMLALEKWSGDGSALWLSLHHVGPRPLAFVRINVASWQPDIYIFADTPVAAEYDLNANTGKLVYSDHPIFFDVNSAQEFADGMNPVTLFVYDFATQNEQVIATSISQMFHPRWVDDDTIECDDPSGDGVMLIPVN
ncbi:MAG: hypothetical protein DWQ07_21735 [Chloroflexi bacterium]|nr:MAG: hypothetical protein DWQ07_21735 [Chloroflexota bacterium]MBL1197327.1 hypothetical protein [Chloroflexota bacterium]NOH14623.1 hypothetical protein [Chloroflexota bacterium]